MPGTTTFHQNRKTQKMNPRHRRCHHHHPLPPPTSPTLPQVWICSLQIVRSLFFLLLSCDETIPAGVNDTNSRCRWQTGSSVRCSVAACFRAFLVGTQLADVVQHVHDRCSTWRCRLFEAVHRPVIEAPRLSTEAVSPRTHRARVTGMLASWPA